MGKSERLHDMMNYLKDKDFFQLKELMDRYDISKSTALRYVLSMEELGMPIYSIAGRHGGYKILPNRLISPITFLTDEIYALYFAMLTLQAYQSTPFHVSVETIKDKFESCLSERNITLLRTMEQIFHLGSLQHHNASPLLKDILQFAMEEKAVCLRYKKGEEIKQYDVQVVSISSAYGQWYVTAYNFGNLKGRVFRCDRIIQVAESTTYQAMPLQELHQDISLLFVSPGSTKFEFCVSEQGVDIFHKNQYPLMSLSCEQGKHIIRGSFNANEEKFITSFLIELGDSVISVKPQSLVSLVQHRLSNLKNFWDSYITSSKDP